MRKILISCEHGGNDISAEYQALFADGQEMLKTHRGLDIGALALYEQLAAKYADFSIFSTTSRLLVELNRSLYHPNLFSAYTKELPKKEKDGIIEAYYKPYRTKVEEVITEWQAQKHTVWHLSIHSFTPELNGEVRNADIGLLYDPKRREEKELVEAWEKALQQVNPALKVRYNYPYLGTADGFTTYLRKRFPVAYAGIELEMNQKHAGNSVVYEAIVESLGKIVQP